MELTTYQYVAWLVLVGFEASTLVALLLSPTWRKMLVSKFIAFRLLKSVVLLLLIHHYTFYFWFYWIAGAFGYALLLLSVLEIITKIAAPVETIPTEWLRLFTYTLIVGLCLCVLAQIITGKLYQNELLAVYRTAERVCASMSGMTALCGLAFSSTMGLTARRPLRLVLSAVSLCTIGEIIFSLFPATRTTDLVHTLTWVIAFGIILSASLMQAEIADAPSKGQVQQLLAISDSYTATSRVLTRAIAETRL